MTAERVAVADIVVGARARPLCEASVERLVASIRAVGLRTPITVRIAPEHADAEGVASCDVPVLVAGRHRLEAAKRLGWDTVPVVVQGGDAREARLWEIAENLHRADLTVQERADHIAEWVRLTEEKVRQDDAPVGGKQPRQMGQRAAARELGVPEPEVRRAVKIAAIVPEARAAADAAGLTTQKARLEIAAAQPAEQAARVAAIASRPKPVPLPKNAIETEDEWRGAMMRLWNRAPADWRERFVDYVQAPVFDATRAGRAP